MIDEKLFFMRSLADYARSVGSIVMKLNQNMEQRSMEGLQQIMHDTKISIT